MNHTTKNSVLSELGTHIEVTTMKIGPGDAQYLLEHPWDKQRDLRPWWVAQLTRQMVDGHWQDGSELRIAMLGGEFWLMQGQHRLRAVISSNTTQEFVLVTHHVASREEIAAIYATLDRGLKRDPKDVYRAFNLAAVTGLNESQLGQVGAALGWLYNGFAGSHHGQVLGSLYVHDLVIEWSPFAKKYYENILGGRQQLTDALRRAPIVAAGLITVRYCEPKAIEFWYQVAHDDGLLQSDPRKKLVNVLIGKKYHHGSYVQETKEAGFLTRKEFVLYTAQCWNAFYAAKPLTRLVPLKPRSPIVFDGTPYNTALPDNGLSSSSNT